jgi:DNA repair exonuclease SbcCD nuclease subunit
MRVLHLADTHLGAWMRAHGAPEGWSRADEHAQAMEQALTPALRGEVDLVLHAGDLFDARTPSRKLQRWTFELLGRVATQVPVVLIPGNHDPASLLRKHRLPPPDLHIVDAPMRLVFGDLAIAAVPFKRTVGGFQRAAAEAVGPGADALLLHQAVQGCRVPRFTFRVGKPAGTIGLEHLPSGPRWAMGGHLHPRQSVCVGELEVVYPGATCRTAAAEGSASKGYALWEFGRRARWRFVDLPGRPFHIVRQPADLEAVQAEDLVRVSNQQQEVYAELFHAARARGAWVVGRGASEQPRVRRDRQTQQRLFEG